MRYMRALCDTFILTTVLSTLMGTCLVFAEDTQLDKSKLVGPDFGKLPTYIKSDTLTLKANEHTFTYAGNVEVKQGDMTMTSSTLDGKYTSDNKIEQLVAQTNVVILKGDNIRATGEKAIYEAAADMVTLTENPELQQDGSILTADVIKIFLKDSRSAAEGTVRVKLIKKDKGPGLESFLTKKEG